MYINSIFDDEV